MRAAWWQVLGVALSDPLPVAEIARGIGVTRQSVQRVADLLVDRGLAAYVANPAHRRAKLLRPTSEGRAAIQRIAPSHAAFAGRLAAEVGTEHLQRTLDDLTQVSKALEVLDPNGR